ncbi:MAG TPA: class I SAM-dependent methyltransferase [Novosphingobium sp.]|nr:class I SAM-dependent methyltransferase [Novosphingobium sp.]
MLVQDISEIEAMLICPSCKSPIALEPRDGPRCLAPACDNYRQGFDLVQDRLVLVDFAKSVLDRGKIRAREGESALARTRWKAVLRRVVDGKNHYAPHFARSVVRELEGSAEAHPTILVIGGGAIGSGAEDLYVSDTVRVVSLDIYASPHVTFVADGHAIPLKDASVDAVWVQAVLEHTVDPQAIAKEMTRVLKPGGLLFANVAFTWPVCEEAYDFTRFSASGLRWLFRDCEVISMGASSGPGTMATLAIRYLAQSLLRSTKLGQIAAFPFFWLRFLDRWCATRRSLDAAPALFFFGRLAPAPLPLDALIAFYDDQPGLEREARALRDAWWTSTARPPSKRLFGRDDLHGFEQDRNVAQQ